MIHGLTESLENGDLATGIDGRAEDDFLEEVDRQMLGARERKKNSSWIEALQRMKIKKFISACSGGDIIAFVGEGRRIQDDKVEAGVAFLKISESISFQEIALRAGAAVQGQIFFRQF